MNFLLVQNIEVLAMIFIRGVRMIKGVDYNFISYLCIKVIGI